MEMKIKPYEELKFTDNFMFCEIMKNNPELCKEVVETILDVKIREIIAIDKEDTIKTSIDGRGVRLDVYLEGDDAIYDIEMQTRDEGNLPKRSRYYQGILDTDYLKAGENYDTLKKTYVIFICMFDLFNKGLPKYTFANKCDEVPELVLGDEATKVFVNAKGTLDDASPKLQEFLQYLRQDAINGPLTEKIDEKLNRALRDEGRKAKYMTFEWELAKKYREGKEEGRAEGKEEGLFDAIRTMLTKISPEEVINLGFSKEAVDAAIKEKAEAYN